MAKAKEYPTYKVGDLVKLNFTGPAYYSNEWLHAETSEEWDGYGIVIGRSNSWYEAYEEARGNDATGTRYWDSVNYCPYKVLMCSTGQVEWVGPESLELIS